MEVLLIKKVGTNYLVCFCFHFWMPECSWLNCEKARSGNVSIKTSLSNCDKAVFRAENVTREVSSPTCDKAVLFFSAGNVTTCSARRPTWTDTWPDTCSQLVNTPLSNKYVVDVFEFYSFLYNGHGVLLFTRHGTSVMKEIPHFLLLHLGSRTRN